MFRPLRSHQVFSYYCIENVKIFGYSKLKHPLYPTIYSLKPDWVLKRGRMIIPESFLNKYAKKEGTFEATVKEFLQCTSLHGLNYLISPKFNKAERFMWAGMFLIGLFFISYSSIDVWERYTSGATLTVIKSTRHYYSEVAFPSVTVCDYSTDWERVLALTENDLPPPFNETKEQAMKLLARLGNFGVADYDYLDQLRLQNVDLSGLKGVNITDLLIKVMRPCEEVLPGICWWRNNEYTCCDLFEMQKTDRGFCWAFNSDTSEEARRLSDNYQFGGYWIDSQNVKRPRRTTSSGPWSGLRIFPEPLPENRLPPGRNFSKPQLLVMINDPRSIPGNWYGTIQPGMQAVLPVWGDSLSANEEIRRSPLKSRSCLFHDENGGQRLRKSYSQEICRHQCYQDYGLKLCNCSPDFLFIDSLKDQPPPCDVDGLLCLSEFNDIFNLMLPTEEPKDFFRDDQGMMCNCPKECSSHQYVSELFAPIQGNVTIDKTSVDIHFKLSTCILYSTDVVTDWLETLVSFGGIISLFLGGSLMSGIELIYFFTVRAYIIQINRKIKTKKLETPIPFLN